MSGRVASAGASERARARASAHLEDERGRDALDRAGRLRGGRAREAREARVHAAAHVAELARDERLALPALKRVHARRARRRARRAPRARGRVRAGAGGREQRAERGDERRAEPALVAVLREDARDDGVERRVDRELKVLRALAHRARDVEVGEAQHAARAVHLGQQRVPARADRVRHREEAERHELRDEARREARRPRELAAVPRRDDRRDLAPSRARVSARARGGVARRAIFARAHTCVRSSSLCSEEMYGTLHSHGQSAVISCASRRAVSEPPLALLGPPLLLRCAGAVLTAPAAPRLALRLVTRGLPSLASFEVLLSASALRPRTSSILVGRARVTVGPPRGLRIVGADASKELINPACVRRLGARELVRDSLANRRNSRTLARPHHRGACRAPPRAATTFSHRELPLRAPSARGGWGEVAPINRTRRGPGCRR